MAINTDPPRTCSSSAWPTMADSTLHPPMTLNSSATSTIHRLTLIRTDLDRQILRYPTLDSLTPGTRWDFELKLFFSNATFILRRGVELEQDPVKFNEHKGKWDTNIRSKIDSVRTTMVKFAPWFQRVHRTLTRLFRVDGRVALGTAMELSEDELLAVFRDLTYIMDRVDVAVNGRSTAPRETRAVWQSGHANGRGDGRGAGREDGLEDVRQDDLENGLENGLWHDLENTVETSVGRVRRRFVEGTPQHHQARETIRAFVDEVRSRGTPQGARLQHFADEMQRAGIFGGADDEWEDIEEP